jgi:hypothetical protein
VRIVNFQKGNHSLSNSLEQRNKHPLCLTYYLSIYKLLTNKINNLLLLLSFSVRLGYPKSRFIYKASLTQTQTQPAQSLTNL